MKSESEKKLVYEEDMDGPATVIELAPNESAIVVTPTGGRIYMSEEESDAAEEARWLVTLCAHAARSEVIDKRLWAYLNERVTRLMLALDTAHQYSDPLSLSGQKKKSEKD